jgi:hypothetical protein
MKEDFDRAGILNTVNRSMAAAGLPKRFESFDQITPDDARFAKKVIESELKTLEVESVDAKTRLQRQLSLVESLNLYKDWETTDTYKFALQPNDCSRFHKALEAAETGLFFDGEKKEFAEPERLSEFYKKAAVFVVKHDWAAALHDSVGDIEEFKLPFPVCVFEFRVMGRTLLLHIWDVDIDLPNSRGHSIWFEGAGGVWLTFPADALREIGADLIREVLAICVVLDAQIAEHQVVRAPAALNAKREKAGRIPLNDYHVIDLSRRVRASARGESTPTGRKVRMHFRRGHWRHFESHKTWINWMLVGNPDLGFIDKEYRI